MPIYQRYCLNVACSSRFGYGAGMDPEQCMEAGDKGQAAGLVVHCSKVLSIQDMRAGHTRGSLVAAVGEVDAHRKGWTTPGRVGVAPAAGQRSHKGDGGNCIRLTQQPDQEVDKLESAAHFGL